MKLSDQFRTSFIIRSFQSNRPWQRKTNRRLWRLSPPILLPRHGTIPKHLKNWNRLLRRRLENLATSFNDHTIPEKSSQYNVSNTLQCVVWFDAVQVWEVKAADISKSSTHTGAIDKSGEGGRVLGCVFRGLNVAVRIRSRRRQRRVIRSWKCIMLRIRLLEVVTWI